METAASSQASTIKTDDIVVTPSGKRAIVLRVNADGFAELRILALAEIEPLITLHWRLLRKMLLGREQPAPVRIDADGRRS